MKVQSIARNTSYFTLALILQKVISLAYFTILARNLVPEDLGKYYLAISITSIFAIIIDLGMTNVLVREVAKKNYKPEKLLSNVLAMKIPLAFMAIGSVVALAHFMGYPELTKTLIYISSISMLLDSFTLSFYSVIRGFHNLKFESIGSVIFQLIVLCVGATFLYNGRDLKSLMFVMALASGFNFLYSLSLTKLKWKLKLFSGIDTALIKTVIGITLPFAAFAILQRLYMYFDSVLLSSLAGDRAVGIYQISFKIIFALQFLPMAFVASLYPAFASYWKDNREQLAVTFERAMNYLIIISFPISVGVITLADKIIMIFKPEYADAVLPLQIIIAALPFIFLNFPVGSLLNACDRQIKNTHNMAIIVTISILLNLFLIPRFDALGASITVLATNILMLGLGIYFIRGLANYRPHKILLVLAKVLLSSIIMGLLVIYLKTLIHFIIIIPIVACFYFVMLLALGAFKKDDITSILGSFINKNQN